MVATDQSLSTAFNTPVVVNLLSNATSPNAGGVLALVGTPTVSNGTFSMVGSTLSITPTPGFVGAMVVRYVVGDGKADNANGTVTITVRAAADVAAPTITLKGASPLTLAQGATYTELGATWTDAKDGSGADTTITGSINTAVIGVYTLTYSKTNAAGKVGSTTRTVLVVATAPVITLNGAASISINVGGTYTEQGANWSDAVNGSGAVTDITGTVNTAVVGSYTLTYRKTDAAGNTGTATRTVTVNATADVTAPVTTSPPALATAATDTTAGVTQTINENGTGYYLVRPAAAAAPTVAEVMADTSFLMFSGMQAMVNLTGLSAETSYKYYFVARDSANNIQAAVSAGLSFTTLALPIVATVALPAEAGSWVTGSTGRVVITNVTSGASWTVEDITPSGTTSGPVATWSSPTSGTGDGQADYLIKNGTEGRTFTVRVTVTKGVSSRSYVVTAPNPIW